MRAKASATAVCVPPFLWWLPLAEAITNGFTADGVRTVGPLLWLWAATDEAAAATEAAAPAWTNSRRVRRVDMPAWYIKRFRFPPTAETMADQAPITRPPLPDRIGRLAELASDIWWV